MPDRNTIPDNWYDPFLYEKEEEKDEDEYEPELEDEEKEGVNYNE